MSAQPRISECLSNFGARLALLAQALGIEIETPTIDSHLSQTPPRQLARLPGPGEHSIATR